MTGLVPNVAPTKTALKNMLYNTPSIIIIVVFDDLPRWALDIYGGPLYHPIIDKLSHDCVVFDKAYSSCSDPDVSLNSLNYGTIYNQATDQKIFSSIMSSIGMDQVLLAQGKHIKVVSDSYKDEEYLNCKFNGSFTPVSRISGKSINKKSFWIIRKKIVEYNKKNILGMSLTKNEITDKLYKYKVKQTFDWLESLFSYLLYTRLYDKSLIIITSASGADFNSKKFNTIRYFQDNLVPSEDALRIPLIVKFPNYTLRGNRKNYVVSIVDIPKTILELCDTTTEYIPSNMVGKNLLEESNSTVVSSTCCFKNNSIIQWPFKLVNIGQQYYSNSRLFRLFNTRSTRLLPKQFLFNLELDPSENKNLFSKLPKIAKGLEKKRKKLLQDQAWAINM